MKITITDINGNKATKEIKVNLKDKTLPKNKLEVVRKSWNTEKMDPNRIKLIEKAVSKVGVIDYIGASEAKSTGFKISNVENPTKLSCSAFVGWSFTHSGVKKIFQPCKDSRFKKISKSKILPGDIVLLGQTATAEHRDHIGIYIGKNSKGEMTFIHCTGRYGKVPGVIINNEDRFQKDNAVFYRYTGFKDKV